MEMDKKAVLFDFDGVTVKSMEQHFDAWRNAFAEWGVHITPDEFFLLEGQGIDTIAHYLGKKHGLSEEQVNAVIKRKKNYYNQFMRLEFYEHFHEMIHGLYEKKIPMAVVTGGDRDRVQKVVETHFDHYFSAVVTIDDVERGKPHPDPFLKAAQLLNVEPESCIVVENAPMGIQGAKAANMTVIAVTTTLPPKHLKQADYIAKDFYEVEKYLHRLLGITG
ncbi:HAD family phosphatase [candidate division KSB1 bacterium]|nr:MAG: HAD family phosphatase [candidate division KSB1 bacterium]